MRIMRSGWVSCMLMILFAYFFYTPPVYASAPSIYSVTPTAGINDTEMVIKSGYPGFGSHEGAVYLDGNLISVVSWDDNKIVVLIPVSINQGMHNLTVRNSIGEESKIKQIRTQWAPEIFRVSPSKIYPGITQMCIEGSSFGTSDDNWSGSKADTDLRIGSAEITRATWNNSEICFKSPSSVLPIISLRIMNFSVSKNFNFAATGLSAYANDTLITKQYFLDVVGLLSAWNTRSTSPSVVVAVIDDGIYLNHPDLKNNIWKNKNETIGNKKDDDKNNYVDDVYGWNFIDGNGEMTVKGSHGTHVAGIIGATGNNGQGVTGVTWNTKLMSLIACDKSGCDMDAIIKAIKYAADNGANVINLSLTSRGTMGYSELYDEAVRYAYNKGVVIVAAAGNGDIESAESIGADLTNIPKSPVCNDLTQNAVLGVSGVDDQKNALRWANYGACADVYAPGISILSTAVPALDDDGEFYSSMDGTSFSSPIVAGLAALIKAQFPEITNREIIDQIIETSTIVRGIRVIDAFGALTTPYVPSKHNPIILPPTNDSPPSPQVKITPTPKVEVVKPKIQTTKADNSNSTETVFEYDAKKATSTPATKMSAITSVTLRGCPAKMCDAKGVYPTDSLFIVKEKYRDKEVWYRGEMPDGNVGWLNSELLTLISGDTDSQVLITKASTTPDDLARTSVSSENNGVGFWAKLIGWLKFWD